MTFGTVHKPSCTCFTSWRLLQVPSGLLLLSPESELVGLMVDSAALLSPCVWPFWNILAMSLTLKGDSGVLATFGQLGTSELLGEK